jgi:glycogen phosphorylase
MTAQARYSLPTVPAELSGLIELALDLRWSWSHTSDVLWRRLDQELWNTTHNPWHILQTVAQTRLQEAAADPDFLKTLEQQVTARRTLHEAVSWFEKTYPGTAGSTMPLGPVAYFCMEFGLSEALPIYSGGLGILAGDFLKTASDLGVPVVGVGLLWQQGYFRQALSAAGDQMEVFPFNDPGQLPIMPLRNPNGEWMSICLSLPRRDVLLRAWVVQAGRVKLYLLDSNDMINIPVDRGITGYLYGGGPEMRLQQEIALGIGGWRLLEQLGVAPDVCHLNEGHAAFAVLERARSYMRAHDVAFEEAFVATRPGNVFTTHTPVEAGFDRFSPALVAEYLSGYADELGIGIEGLLAMGRPPGACTDHDAQFNMAFLALHGSGAVNGVSQLHGEVSRKLFQPLFPRWPLAEIPVGHVTNGVHVPSWDSAEADRLWTKLCGKERWLGDPFCVTDAMRRVSDEDLWTFREISRRTLITVAREHIDRQGPIAGSLEAIGSDPSCLCDPTVLTLGFARRFATYKRANLLLHDPDRLQRLLCGPHSRMQLIISGKAHPADGAGKAMIRQWTEFIRQCTVRPHIVFLVDYDMDIAEHLVHGIDVWLNTPRRPWEASGTSGMKVLVNGGLNLSELDGWWAEAYSPDIGWALGDRLEHDSDPGWDAYEAERLYELLETEVLPEFYDRDEQGIPRKWVARVRESMARLVPEFSTNRMMKDYLDLYYLPAAAAYRQRTYAGGLPQGDPLQPSARDLVAGIGSWHTLLDEQWHEIRFLDYSLTEKGGSTGRSYEARIRVDLGQIPPDAVLVQLFAEPLDGGPPERHTLITDLAAMKKGRGADAKQLPHKGEYAFKVVFASERPPGDYTPRVVPVHRFAQVPLEAGHILWYR